MILKANAPWRSRDAPLIAVDLTGLRQLAGLSRERAADYLGVPMRTLERWERANQAPRAVVLLLQVRQGELGALDPAWTRWRLAQGELFAPDDPHGYTPGHILTLPYLHEQVRALRVRAEAAEARHQGCALPPVLMPAVSPESQADARPTESVVCKYAPFDKPRGKHRRGQFARVRAPRAEPLRAMPEPGVTTVSQGAGYPGSQGHALPASVPRRPLSGGPAAIPVHSLDSWQAPDDTRPASVRCGPAGSPERRSLVGAVDSSTGRAVDGKAHEERGPCGPCGVDAPTTSTRYTLCEVTKGVRSTARPAAMGAVSVYLRNGYAGNVTTLRTLQLLCRFSIEDAANACLVSPETFRRWRSDRPPNPTAVRLLAILGGYLPWSGWEDWEMHNGLLFPPGYTRHGIAPGDILALPLLNQLLNEYRRQSRRPTKSELRQRSG